jgi:hypothetical protein
MSKLIALRSGFNDIILQSAQWNDFSSHLKQQALLFDQIGFLRLGGIQNYLQNETINQEFSQRLDPVFTELEWLQQVGVVFDLSVDEAFRRPPIDEFTQSTSEKEKEIGRNLIKRLEKIQANIVNIKDDERTIKLINEHQFIFLRLLSMGFSMTKGVTAVTTFPYPVYTRKISDSTKSDVAQIVISKLPIPNNETPWEQIIDYRNYPENQNNLLGLRRWIRKISKGELSNTEIEEEIEWRINEFRNHMNLHKMKANTETLEVIVKAPLEIIENLIRLKFSKIPEPFFAIKKRQINLMEAELNAPGREISYIIKTQEAFQSYE